MSSNREIDFESIERIFRQRDEALAAQRRQEAMRNKAHSTSRSVPVRKYKTADTRKVSGLERTPGVDVYLPAANSARRRREGDIVDYKPKHMKSSASKHKKSAKSKLPGILAAAAMTLTTCGVIIGVSSAPPQKPSTHDVPTVAITANVEHNPSSPVGKAPSIDTPVPDTADKASASTVVEETPAFAAEETPETAQTQAPALKYEKQAQIEELNRIFDENPDVKQAFDEVELTLRRASKEYGSNMVQVLKDKSEEFNSEVPVPLLACIMQLESRGFMTDWRTGEINKSSANACGFMQITRVCEDDVNTRLNPDGKIRDKYNMSDNLDIGIITLGHLWDCWDEDVPKVLTAYNAGSGEVLKGNIMEDYVRVIRDEHYDVLSEYPEIWEYMMERDYYNNEEDGIYHVAIDEYGEPDYDFDRLNYNPYD